MLFRLLSPLTRLPESKVGDVVTLEQLKDHDVNWLGEVGAIEPVEGPTSAIRSAAATADELIGDVVKLQAKWEAAAKRCDELSAEVAALRAENADLKDSLARGEEELRSALSTVDRVNTVLRGLGGSVGTVKTSESAAPWKAVGDPIYPTVDHGGEG